MADNTKPQISYQDDLLAKAITKYPFLKRYNPAVTLGTGDGYAETWARGEPGDQQYPRPKDIPLDRSGVQVFRPESFGPDDLAAEFLHVDPLANHARQLLTKMLSPNQVEALKKSSKDYEYTLQRGEGEERALQNAVDSALRGYTTGQWPQEAIQGMGYSKKQLKLLDNLRNYMFKE